MEDEESRKEAHLDEHARRLSKLTAEMVYSLPDAEIMSYANLMVGSDVMNGFTLEPKYFSSEQDAYNIASLLNERIRIVLEKQGDIRPPRKAMYIGITGALLDKQLQPAKGLHEFLAYITYNYVCFWLTNHERDGDRSHLYSFLYECGIPEETIALTRFIWPTHWDILKTEAIDFNREFVWFEDHPTSGELEVLKKHGKSDSIYKGNRKRGDGLQVWLDTIVKCYDEHI